MGKPKMKSSSAVGRWAWFDRVDVRWLYAAAFLLSALALAPILHSGFFDDDSLNSALWSSSTMAMRGSNVITAAITEQYGWMSNQGRFFPVTAYVYFLFYLINGNAGLFKVLMFALVLLDLALFAYLVKRLSRSTALAGLALALPPLVIQFRSLDFHDPTLAFAGMLPVLFALIIGSLILLVSYLERGDRRFLIASLVCYAVGLMTYEISIAMFPLYFLVIWLFPRRHPVRKSAKMTLPYAVLSGCAVAIAVALRLAFGRALTSNADQFAKVAKASGDLATGAYAPSFAPGAIVTTFVKQVVAAFPLSYRILDASTGKWASGFMADFARNPVVSGLLVIAYVAIFAWLALQVRSERALGAAPKWQAPLWLGVGLVLLPQVLISLSPRYQMEVFWGVGYLPVYFGYFGMALLCALAIGGVFRFAAGRGDLVLWLVVALVGLPIAYVGVVNYHNNADTVEVANRDYLYSRAVVTDAIRHGLLKDVPPDSTILVPESSSWDSTSFYEGASGLPVKKVSPMTDLQNEVLAVASGKSDATRNDVYDVPSTANIFFLSRHGSWQGNGVALCGRLRQVMVSPAGKTALVLEPVTLYASASHKPWGYLEVRGFPSKGLESATPKAAGLDPKVMSPVAAGSDWGVYKTLDGQAIEIDN